MDERNPSIKHEFNIAAEINESQKLQMEIDRLKDDTERGRLNRLKRRADEELEKEHEWVRKEEEREVREELEKRSRLKEELHLTLDGAPRDDPRRTRTARPGGCTRALLGRLAASSRGMRANHLRSHT